MDCCPTVAHLGTPDRTIRTELGEQLRELTRANATEPAAANQPTRLTRLREQPLELVEGIAPAVVVKRVASLGPERALG